MPRQEEWNSCLLLHAHGFRPEGTELVAEIDDPFWWRLVQQGMNQSLAYPNKAGGLGAFRGIPGYKSRGPNATTATIRFSLTLLLHHHPL